MSFYSIFCLFTALVVVKVETGGQDACSSTHEASSELHFISPHFPHVLQGDLVCSFTFELIQDFAGLLLEFAAFESDGFKLGTLNSECDQDVLYIRGFETWSPPPLCGNLTGYSVSIDNRRLENSSKITLLAVMAGSSYRWSIKIKQFSKQQCVQSPTQPKYTHDAYDNDWKRRKRDAVPLVVNGEDADAGSVPWQASLRINIETNEIYTWQRPVGPTGEKCDREEQWHMCGGAVIGDREVILAAHCFESRTKVSAYVPIDLLFVHLGDMNTCHDDSEDAHARVQTFGVESILLHYAYEPKVFMNDLAIIRLNASIELSKFVQKIELAGTGETFDGHDAMISGFGRTNVTDRRSGSTTLKQSQNLIVELKSKCTEYVQEFTGPRDVVGLQAKYDGYYDSVVCTSTKNVSKDVQFGKGDSGGALVSYFSNSDEPILVGIVSFYIEYYRHIRNSAGDFIDFYQSVAYFRHWIDATMCMMIKGE